MLLGHVSLNEIEAQLLVAVFALNFDVLLFVVLLHPVRLRVSIVTFGTLLRIIGVQLTGFWLLSLIHI